MDLRITDTYFPFFLDTSTEFGQRNRKWINWFIGRLVGYFYGSFGPFHQIAACYGNHFSEHIFPLMAIISVWYFRYFEIMTFRLFCECVCVCFVSLLFVVRVLVTVSCGPWMNSFHASMANKQNVKMDHNENVIVCLLERQQQQKTKRIIVSYNAECISLQFSEKKKIEIPIHLWSNNGEWQWK